MSLLAELRDRAKKGPGNIDVVFGDGKKVVVPLQYPKAAAQAELVGFFDNFDDKATGTKAAEQNIALNFMVVRACIKTTETIPDDELNILIRESGGYQGDLVQRCMELMGMADRKKGANQTPKGGTRRGR